MSTINNSFDYLAIKASNADKAAEASRLKANAVWVDSIKVERNEEIYQSSLKNWKHRHRHSSPQKIVPFSFSDALEETKSILIGRKDLPCEFDFCFESFHHHNSTHLHSVFNLIEEIVCTSMSSHQYDISARSLMVFAGLLQDLQDLMSNNGLTQNSDQDNIDKESDYDINGYGKGNGAIVDKMRSLNMDDACRLDACHTLFVSWHRLLFKDDETTVPQSILRSAFVTCTNEMEESAFALIELCLSDSSTKSHSSLQNSRRIPEEKVGTWVIASAPARIDLAGAWSDTPPICFEYGGAVAGIAVKVDNKNPLLCRCRKLSGKKGIVLRTESRDIKTGSLLYEDEAVLEKISHLADFRDPHAHCALHKCVLICLGLVDVHAIHFSNNHELQSHINNFCKCPDDQHVGLEIVTTSLLPRGSGMGSSSILSGCIVASIARCVGLEMTSKDSDEPNGICEDQLIQSVVMVEQLLTTGGGWQDQVGGLIGGLKLGKSAKGKLPLHTSVEKVSLKPEIAKQVDEKMALCFTGHPRLAKNILQNVLRRWARRSPDVVNTVQELVTCGASAFHALECGDFQKLGACITHNWELKKVMTGESAEPECVRQTLQFLREENLISGGLLVGAGGGGFLALLAQDGKKSEDVERAMTINNNILPSSASWHKCTFSPEGLRVQLEESSGDCNNGFQFSWHD